MSALKNYEYVVSFNSILKKLITFTASKSKILKIGNLKNRAFIAINTDPLVAITNVGPYLIKYAEVIKSHNLELMLDYDFKDETDEISDTNDSNELLKVIGYIKKIYTTKCDKTEKLVVADLMDDLLIVYCNYIS